VSAKKKSVAYVTAVDESIEVVKPWISFATGFLCLLKEVRLFVEKNKIIEEQDVEGWINGPSFFMDVTGHLNTNSFNKELQGKDKLITEMFDSIKAFKVVL
jgi:hypothetical protein